MSIDWCPQGKSGWVHQNRIFLRIIIDNFHRLARQHPRSWPGVEPGSPTGKEGALTAELSRQTECDEPTWNNSVNVVTNNKAVTLTCLSNLQCNKTICIMLLKKLENWLPTGDTTVRNAAIPVIIKYHSTALLLINLPISLWTIK